MKKFSTIFLLTALTALFFACSSDDDNLPEEPKPVSVKISYFYENTADFFRYVNAEITYLDKNGKEQKEVLNSTKTSWKYEETINYASAPKDYACKIILKKTGTEPEKETCKFQGYGSYAMTVDAIYSDGETYILGPIVEKRTTASENNIVKALETIPATGKEVYNYTYTLNK